MLCITVKHNAIVTLASINNISIAEPKFCEYSVSSLLCKKEMRCYNYYLK
jgi:hypothetical protein